MIMIYTLDTWTRFAKMAIYCLRWVTRKVINNSLACKKREDEAKVVAGKMLLGAFLPKTRANLDHLLKEVTVPSEHRAECCTSMHSLLLGVTTLPDAP